MYVPPCPPHHHTAPQFTIQHSAVLLYMHTDGAAHGFSLYVLLILLAFVPC
jgi:hypothetical protein